MIQPPIVAALLVPFILWRVYLRIRRLMVRQRSHAWRHWLAAILFPLLGVLLGAAALARPLALAGLAAGLAGGIGLGAVALRRTRYEKVGADLFFTPDARIGIAVGLVFLVRLLYRGYEFYVAGATANDDFSRSPLTLAVFGVLAGYYAMYASGLLRWRKSVQANGDCVE